MEQADKRSTRDASLLTAYACLVAAPLFWAGNFVVARAFFADIPPVAFNFWRWLLAFLFLAPFTLTSASLEIRQLVREWRLCAILGATGIALFQTFSYEAVHTTTVLNAALYLSATPVFVTAISWLWFGDRLTRRQALGIILSLFGVFLIVTRADPSVLLALRFHPGDLWMMAAVPLWAVYSVLIQQRPPDLSQRSLLMGSIFFGLLFLAPLYVWEIANGYTIKPGPQTAAVLLYVGLFASAVAFVCWQKGVSALGANKSSLFIHLIPVFSALAAFLFLGEPIWGPHLSGALFILAGIALTTARRKNASLQPAAP